MPFRFRLRFRSSFSLLAAFAAVAFCAPPARALDRPEITFPVFQFPADRIPRVDGDASDWDIVPESYVVGSKELVDGSTKPRRHDPKNLDVRVRVGWVKGLNRLYFLYEAYDDYWDFSQPGLHNDTFELIVDGDASGGVLVDSSQKSVWRPEIVGERRMTPDGRISLAQEKWAIHGVHAQNYHIFTPAVDKDWALAWGSATWTKELPWANAATKFDFKPGEAGKLTLEFWITPFDYAGPEGPERAVESLLYENKIIGLGWIIIDYDDAESGGRNNGFWMLGRQRSMFGDASDLPAFRLMPREPFLRGKRIDAQWSFKLVDIDRRVVAFKDESFGEITAWRWDFGDGRTSTEQHPLHAYEKPGNYVVILDIEGPAGKSRRSKVWDVQMR
jgi:hypothetical protein